MTQVSQGREDQSDASWQPGMAEIHGVRLVRTAPFGHLRQASENPTATAVSAGKRCEKWAVRLIPTKFHEVANEASLNVKS